MPACSADIPGPRFATRRRSGSARMVRAVPSEGSAGRLRLREGTPSPWCAQTPPPAAQTRPRGRPGVRDPRNRRRPASQCAWGAVGPSPMRGSAPRCPRTTPASPRSPAECSRSFPDRNTVPLRAFPAGCRQRPFSLRGSRPGPWPPTHPASAARPGRRRRPPVSTPCASALRGTKGSGARPAGTRGPRGARGARTRPRSAACGAVGAWNLGEITNKVRRGGEGSRRGGAAGGRPSP
ncbi:hypothetical protein DFJ74DRAFT_669280 [Hyaloraphidium curvatum]|nr:hypothetical protein DFJ74DRAFT_669280 [Hyaloraphidium curvatum]